MDRAWGDDYVVDRHCLGLVRWPESLWTRSGAPCVVFHCCSEVGHLHGCSEALLVLRPRRMPGGPCSRRVEWTLQLQSCWSSEFPDKCWQWSSMVELCVRLCYSDAGRGRRVWVLSFSLRGRLYGLQVHVGGPRR